MLYTKRYMYSTVGEGYKAADRHEPIHNFHSSEIFCWSLITLVPCVDVLNHWATLRLGQPINDITSV